MARSSFLLATVLLLVPLSCVEEQINEPNTTTTKKAPADGAGAGGAGGPLAGGQNGGGTAGLPPIAAVPNYGGAPSILANLVDALPMSAARGGSTDTSNQPFFENGRFTGGGILASVGNLLFDVFGLGQKR